MNRRYDVRLATVDDTDAIAMVHVLTWQTSYRGLIPDGLLDSLAIEPRAEYWRRTIARADPAHPVWVATIDDHVVGFTDAGPSRDPDANPAIGELYAIYVLAEYQGRGIGQALLGVAASWLAQRYRSATLWVLESNERSRRFYELSGWRFDGTLKREALGSFILSEARYRIDFRAPGEIGASTHK